MAESDGRVADLLRENEELRARLADAEEHVRAFRAGEVDAVVVYEDQAERIYTLQGADHSYRVMVEQMNEAAVVLAKNLTVLFANANLAKLVGEAPEDVLGSSFERFVPDDERHELRGLLHGTREGGRAGELALLAKGRRIPVRLSLSPIVLGNLNAVCLLITDLTDPKRNEQMLAEGRLASAILEQQAEATVICGPDGRVLRASRVTEQLCGRDPVGEVLESVLPLELADGSRFWMGNLRRGEPLQGAHVRLRREGAPALDLLLSATVLTGTNDVSLGWVLSLVDITERRRADEELRHSRARLAWVLRVTGVGTWLNELPLGRLNWDAQTRRLFFVAPEAEPTIDLFWSRVHPDDREPTRLAVESAIRDQTLYAIDHRAVDPATGAIRWIHSAGQATYAEDATPIRFDGVNYDITARKEAEEQLREFSQRLGYHVDHSPLGVIEWGPDMRLSRWSGEAEHIFGWKAEEVLGKKMDEFRGIYEEDEPQVDEVKTELVSGASVHRFSANRNYRKDGSVAHCEWYNSSLLDESGQLRSILSLVLDVTARKRAEEELRQAKVAADAAARAKAEFLANMSHEIRTPMNAVIGFTDLLFGTPLDADQRRFLDLIKSSGEALLEVVNDVLDLSKMEAGKFDFAEEPFDLRDLVEKVSRSLGLRAHQKGLELTAHVPFSVPTALVGDPARLRQVLVNLLGNAVKFTDQGDVHLAVRQVGPPTEDAESSVSLRFSVRDTGIGIPREKLGLLFQSFQQVDSSSTRRHEGTGLGLFISRRIVEQMGGRIEVKSQEGAGSTFSFTVRFRLQPGAAVGTAEVEDLRGHKVLVVDDNATNRMIVLEMLTTQGMAVALASGGEEALGLLRAAEAAGQPHELLLVDCRMPRMDGFQLIERVKGDSRFPNPVIVMITSDDLPACSARARAAGAAAYLVKPVVCAELLSAIRSVLLGAGVQQDAPTKEKLPVVPAGRPLRLLLAEDNTVNQLLVRALVEREGWSIDVVEEGRSALAALSGEHDYDLVLMDVQMPVLDGYEATKSLRELEKHGKKARRTPVIGLTARALPGDRQRCLDAGMDDYLPKPLDPQALYDMVRRHVRGNETREPAAKLPAGLMANPAVRGKVIGQLLTDLPHSIAALRDAVDRRSAGDIEARAHRLLGSLLVFGADDSAEAARRLEACGREQCLDEAAAMLETLEEELRRLAAYLEELRDS
ncbi:MAG: response regulator [Deltaproteobacteria bacterium]|nr:response regulator [Deltaproteobacteria bacterium]